MKIKEGMENNYQEMAKEWKKDFMGASTLRYLERWANIMEALAEDGMNIGEAAEQSNHVADTEGITGYMYGMAVSVLTEVWEYGDDLRVWHNQHYGYEGEGTVNPAVLKIDNEQQPSTDEDYYEEQ